MALAVVVVPAVVVPVVAVAVVVTGVVDTEVAVTGVAATGVEAIGAEVIGVALTGVVRSRLAFWGGSAITIHGDTLTDGDILIITIRTIRTRSRITIRPRDILIRTLPQ